MQLTLYKILKYTGPFLKTFLFYKPFLRRSGKFVVIIRPLQMTLRYITLGNKVLIGHHARIEGVSEYGRDRYAPSITIGNNVSIQQNLHLTAGGNLTIGDNTAIAANVTISDIIHGYQDINLPPEKQSLSIKETLIGENCKLFNNVVILPGTKLGKHNIIGANSVVSGTYPDYVVIAGSPAKIIKRFNEATSKWEKTDSKGNFIASL